MMKIISVYKYFYCHHNITFKHNELYFMKQVLRVDKLDQFNPSARLLLGTR